MKLSIITSSLSRAGSLERAIASVLFQALIRGGFEADR